MHVPEGHYQTANESKEHMNCNKLIGSKYNNPWKRKGAWWEW